MGENADDVGLLFIPAWSLRHISINERKGSIHHNNWFKAVKMLSRSYEMTEIKIINESVLC